MTRQLFSLAALLLIISCGFAQSWNSSVNTEEDVDLFYWGPYAEDMAFIDLLPAFDGLHVLTVDDDGVVYRNFDTDGSLSSSTTISSTSTAGAITGDDENLFVTYYDSLKLKVAASTNGGSSWSTETSYPISSYGAAEWIDVDLDLVSNNLVHVAWNDEDDDVRYVLYNYSGDSWGSSQLVATNSGGAFIEVSEDYVHVSYTPNYDYLGFDDADNMIREKYFTTGQWLTPQTVHSDHAWGQGLVATDSVHMFFFESQYD